MPEPRNRNQRIYLMEQTFATLFSLTNKLQMNGDKCLDALTARQLLAMIAILHLPGERATLKNVAAKLGTSKQSAKHIVANLQAKGCIGVGKNERDKRAVTITITDKGKEILQVDAEKGYNFFDELYRCFSNEELELLWMLLKKLYAYDGKEHDGFEDAARFE